MKTAIKLVPICLRAVALMAVLAATAAQAQVLRPVIDTRPLTPQDIKDYALTGAQGASGLTTVPIGQPVYLEAQVTNTFPAANILSVNWNLSSKPVGSAAVLGDSPLGTNVPIYKPADRLVAKVAGRALLTPDVVGQYTVTAAITTTTGISNVTKQITAATYMGLNTCALCHSGGILAPDKVTPWSETAHATKLTREIDGGTDPATSHYSKNCISCHTVGYNANTNAVNGGFDDVATQLGWNFPTVLTNGNWLAVPAALKNLSNIQCENCHGPGSEHAFSLGNTNRISVSWSPGNCAQCHDSKNNHARSAEWANSGHAVSPRQTGSGCVRCHTASGFANYTAGAPAVSTPYEAIGCVACHDPHDATNPHQLRKVSAVTLNDGITTITNAGNSQLCMNCHQSRRNAATYVETTAGSGNFGPHYSCQTDMFMGVNAITYGKVIPSSAHRNIEGACLTCHKQSVATSNPAFTHAGGHTFSLKWDGGTVDNTADDVYLTSACTQCHGEIESFDFKRQDYDGDGIVSGAQTEVKGLLHKLGKLLPPIGDPAVAITAAYTKQQLRAVFNYRFVEEDGSHGVHNLPYAVGILKAAIADLTGDANEDGLPDAWQIQYFGSATAPNAEPNASSAGDGVPNWLKYALGLDPTVAGVVLPDGVVWANAGPTPGSTNSLQIYTAAEVVFNTELGKTYQLQAISTLGGGWDNVGAPVAGTGSSFSFVTPTRNNAQQFFRVVQTP